MKKAPTYFEIMDNNFKLIRRRIECAFIRNPLSAKYTFITNNHNYLYVDNFILLGIPTYSIYYKI